MLDGHMDDKEHAQPLKIKRYLFVFTNDFIQNKNQNIESIYIQKKQQIRRYRSFLLNTA